MRFRKKLRALLENKIWHELNDNSCVSREEEILECDRSKRISTIEARITIDGEQTSSSQSGGALVIEGKGIEGSGIDATGFKVPAITAAGIDGSVWTRGVAKLEAELDPQIFSAYIKPLRFSSFHQQDKIVDIVAPSSFVRNHVDRSYRSRLEEAIAVETGMSPVNIRLSVDAAGDSTTQRSPLSQPVVVKKTSAATENVVASGVQVGDDGSGSGGIGLNKRYTFATYIVGSGNQFCHAAAMHVAEQPGLNYNPLFIYGGVGLGKTHLLHAIGNTVLSRRPNAKVVYMSSETFTNELIQALRNARMEEFKNKMRSIEVLLIDDIQFMSGKERTQEEFFHTFNTLYNAKHQIVITSDKIPHEIPGLEERLKTRFSWGLTADLQAPDFETRVAILRRKATADGFELPENVASFIAENVSSNVRELEGALTKLHAVSSLQQLPVNLELCKSALQPLIHSKITHVSIDDIKAVVAEFFNIKVADMVSKRRTKNLSFPRHIAMYLCRKHTTASYPEIGFQFGGRDHSSVIHAANVVSGKVSADPSVTTLVARIEQKLLKNR